MTSAAIARVLVDSPLPQLDRLFDYSVPESLRDEIALGVRVRVPLRSAGRIADGFVVELTDSIEYGGALSEIDAVVSAAPVLSAEVATVARRVADRAAGSAVDIVRLAVPGRQVRVEKTWLASDRQPLEPTSPPAPIAGYGHARIESALADGARLAVDAIPGVVEVAPGTWVGRWAVLLAAAAAHTVSSGASAIVSVPDYRDQEQLESALRAILPPERVVRLDARQSNPDRYRGFLRCLGDDALVIVGNRSAVYAPAARLGLIAVWDDGDPLHFEPLAPYVHTRDAALLRQELQECALLFAGHSRSTEVERLVEVGWVESIAPAPLVLPRVVPTAQQTATDRLAAQARIPSSAWREAREALQSGPVLVQVSRPGYAPRLACVDCGRSARCARCEGPLQTRSANSPPSCSWCGALAVDWRCDNCDGTRLRQIGAGATRTADDLGRAFPGVRIIIADGEHQILNIGPQPALVIATRGAEPIAAGGYRAILLLDGERMMARESLRVAEDCLRWWSNAAALAAPGAPTLLVGVGGSIATALATWRQPDYARAELADRRRLRFPPAVRVATVTGELDAVTRAVERAAATAGIPAEDVLGPVDLATGAVRTILRFEYATGPSMAAALRSELVKAATTRRKVTAVKGPRPPLPPTLRVHFDDAEPFLDL